jgi:hypothetical protein
MQKYDNYHIFIKKKLKNPQTTFKVPLALFF